MLTHHLYCVWVTGTELTESWKGLTETKVSLVYKAWKLIIWAESLDSEQKNLKHPGIPSFWNYVVYLLAIESKYLKAYQAIGTLLAIQAKAVNKKEKATSLYKFHLRMLSIWGNNNEQNKPTVCVTPLNTGKCCQGMRSSREGSEVVVTSDYEWPGWRGATWNTRITHICKWRLFSATCQFLNNHSEA